jgi:hypothetical protein
VLSRRCYQPSDFDSVEAMRITFRTLAPRGGGLAHDDWRYTECAVVEVENVRIEAEGLQQGSVHRPDSVIQGMRARRRQLAASCG